jgi:hypothetical protein
VGAEANGEADGRAADDEEALGIAARAAMRERATRASRSSSSCSSYSWRACMRADARVFVTYACGCQHARSGRKRKSTYKLARRERGEERERHGDGGPGRLTSPSARTNAGRLGRHGRAARVVALEAEAGEDVVDRAREAARVAAGAHGRGGAGERERAAGSGEGEEGREAGRQLDHGERAGASVFGDMWWGSRVTRLRRRRIV